MKKIIIVIFVLLFSINAYSADIYLRSTDGNDADDGSTWALAKATLVSALTATGAGGRVFMSDNHAETQFGAITLTGGTINAPIQVISVNDAGDPEPPTSVLAGGSVSQTSTTADIAFDGYAYMYGVTFSSKRDFTWQDLEVKWIYDTCIFNLTGGNDEWIVGSVDEDVFVFMKNCTIDLGFSTNIIRINKGGKMEWVGGSLSGTIPTVLFNSLSRSVDIKMRDFDLSSLSTSLIDPTGTTGFFKVLLERCKLHASLTVLQNPIQTPGSYVKLHSCDSGDTTYSIIEESYEGTVIDETTIVRTGGASDGTTSFSYKMTTNANAVEFVQPLISPPIVAWTTATTSTNYDVEIVIDSATTLNNDDVWMELETPGSDAQGVITTTRLSNILSTPSELTASTETWSGVGGLEKKYRLRGTVAPGKAGPVTARIFLARPSTVIYVDMLITES